VVAWEANDSDLKHAFRSGIDVHNHNGQKLFGTGYEPKKIRRKLTMRDEMKRGVHGTNYYAGIVTLSKTLGWTREEVRVFQEAWFRAHPGIREWHRRTEQSLLLNRRVRNRFGYEICYFDRPDGLLPEGLAWIPQSTVAEVCGRGMCQLYERAPWCNLLLQVHDSLVFEIPAHRASPSNFAFIREALRVQVPYEDPLEIAWSISLSDRSWGEMKKVKWEELT
jgi:DNA polymerase I-like protein with 3'-5' exonuclease and polymerase domains